MAIGPMATDLMVTAPMVLSPTEERGLQSLDLARRSQGDTNMA